MNRQQIYDRLHYEGSARRGYDKVRTERVGQLVEEWMGKTRSTDPSGHAALEAMSGPDRADVYPAVYQSCRTYVLREYRARYGIGPLGFLLWPIIQAFISWLVGRMLEEWFS